MNYDRTLAIAVRDLLRSPDMSTDLISIDPERIRVVYLPRFPLESLVDCFISIAPRSRMRERASRASMKHEHQIQIAVMMQCTPDSELFDALLDFVTAVEDRLSGPSTYMRSSVDELYSLDALEQHNVFRSIITATYQITQ